MRQDVSETLEVSRQELLRRAGTYGDLEVWAAVQQSLEETVLSWLHEHPGREAACRVHSEQYFVALAFERLRQATIQGQLSCETLSEVLMFLGVSLSGAILETLRDSQQPGPVSSPWPDGEDHLDSGELWAKLQARLSNRREQRLAYLLYQCRLEPAEIVRSCPLEWGNLQEVIRLRRTIFMQLMQGLICEGQTFV